MPTDRAARTASAGAPAIGRQVRRWRHERGLTLAQVAQRARLNVGYLSQIENDKATPSLDCLAAIGDALEVPIAWFLVDSSPPPRVVRASERRRRKGPAGVVVEEVDGGIPRGLRILYGKAPAGGHTGHHAHTGDEHHVILAGRWRFTQGDHVIEAGPGDYVLIDGSVPHDVEVLGDEPGEVLIVGARAASGVAD
jgi:transcriptional regulator with XRE-family HTH domain